MDARNDNMIKVVLVGTMAFREVSGIASQIGEIIGTGMGSGVRYDKIEDTDPHSGAKRIKNQVICIDPDLMNDSLKDLLEALVKEEKARVEYPTVPASVS